MQPGQQVLEIGYGTGHSLVALAQAVGPQGRVFGIDVSDGMRDVAAARVQEAGLADRVQLVAGPTPPLPYSDGQFDECELTLRDLNLIVESIIKTVASIYHARIAYPASGPEERRA